METALNIRTLSDLLEDLCCNIEKQENFTLRFLVEALHERGFGIIMLIFAAPAALPVPGFNTIMALPLVFLAVQQTMGRHTIWLPEKLLRKTLSREKIARVIRAIIPWLEKAEILIKPRMEWVTWNGPAHLFGFLATLMALMACLPVPLTHTVPSIGIAIISVGILMRDGLAVIAGTVLGMAWLTLLVGSVALFGPEAFDAGVNALKSLF